MTLGKSECTMCLGPGIEALQTHLYKIKILPVYHFNQFVRPCDV